MDGNINPATPIKLQTVKFFSVSLACKTKARGFHSFIQRSLITFLTFESPNTTKPYRRRPPILAVFQICLKQIYLEITADSQSPTSNKLAPREVPAPEYTVAVPTPTSCPNHQPDTSRICLVKECKSRAARF